MFDIIIIGGGPGGYSAALESSKLGKKVLLIEKEELGGVCLNHGCIPTKSLLNSGKLYKKSKSSGDQGIDALDIKFNFRRAMEWKDEVVSELKASLTSLLSQKSIKIINGIAIVKNRYNVEVHGEVYKTKYILLATGASSMIPPIKGIESEFVVTSREILELKNRPDSLTIIGGGVIGLEFASFFHSIGVNVTVIEMCKTLLPSLESRITGILEKSLKYNIYLDSEVKEINGNRINFVKGNVELTVKSDLILIATGRKSNCEQFMNLDIVKNGRIEVDDTMKTGIDGIYAVGDCTALTFLAHGSIKMAEVAVTNIFGKRVGMDFNLIPSIVYSEPEIATIGKTVKEAKNEKLTIIKNSYYLKNSGRYRAENGYENGLCIVIAHKESRVILGVHIIGSGVSEIISLGVIAISEGYTLEKFKELVFPHPTLSETIKDTIFFIN